MSEPTVPREWRFYLDDMIGFCERVQLFTTDTAQLQFVADLMRFDATIRNLELIGESATHIPEPIRKSAPNIPWRMITATRNQLIHGYLGIDNDTLWSIVQTDIPVLLVNLRELRIKLAS